MCGLTECPVLLRDSLYACRSVVNPSTLYGTENEPLGHKAAQPLRYIASSVGVFLAQTRTSAHLT